MIFVTLNACATAGKRTAPVSRKRTRIPRAVFAASGDTRNFKVLVRGRRAKVATSPHFPLCMGRELRRIVIPAQPEILGPRRTLVEALSAKYPLAA